MQEVHLSAHSAHPGRRSGGTTVCAHLSKPGQERQPHQHERHRGMPGLLETRSTKPRGESQKAKQEVQSLAAAILGNLAAPGVGSAISLTGQDGDAATSAARCLDAAVARARSQVRSAGHSGAAAPCMEWNHLDKFAAMPDFSLGDRSTDPRDNGTASAQGSRIKDRPLALCAMTQGKVERPEVCLSDAARARSGDTGTLPRRRLAELLSEIAAPTGSLRVDETELYGEPVYEFSHTALPSVAYETWGTGKQVAQAKVHVNKEGRQPKDQGSEIAASSSSVRYTHKAVATAAAATTAAATKTAAAVRTAAAATAAAAATTAATATTAAAATTATAVTPADPFQLFDPALPDTAGAAPRPVAQRAESYARSGGPSKGLLGTVSPRESPREPVASASCPPPTHETKTLVLRRPATVFSARSTPSSLPVVSSLTGDKQCPRMHQPRATLIRPGVIKPEATGRPFGRLLPQGRLILAH